MVRFLSKIFIKTLLIILLASHFVPAQEFQNTVPWGDGRSKAENLQISLITFSPGDYLTDWFGHTALAVQDTLYKVARVYNFGLFSFGDGFIKRFAMGRLIFWAGDASLGAIMKRYMRANRTISFQVLNIVDEKKLELAKELVKAVQPKNSHYLYHHYNENCATRLRDLIDEAVGGQLKEATKQPARLTFREHTRRYTAHNPLMLWLLMFLMNDSIDKPIQKWDEMFLPDELAKYVGNLNRPDGKPVVSESYIYYDSKRPGIPLETSFLPLWTIFAGLILAGTAFILGKLAATRNSRLFKNLFKLYGFLISFIFGFIGSILFFMSTFTDHLVTRGNENLFLANPITFFASFLILFTFYISSDRIEKLTAYCWYILAALSFLLLMLKLLPVFDQDNYMAIVVLLPLNIAMAAVMWLYKIKK